MEAYSHPRFYLAILTFLSLAACRENASSQDKIGRLHETDPFREYWYSGEAEINAYELSESRYGENRDGTAVLIFVTEPFSESRQVKVDEWENNPDATTVMKVNFTKKFITGIYPYSMMLSAFTPVQLDRFPHSMKVVMSSQEWCGQTFMQANLTGNRYKVQQYSYFEKEGDENYAIKVTWLEDEIWNMIRLNPSGLPQGEIEMIPGFFHLRLRHHPVKLENVIATKVDKGSTWEYKLQYTQVNRTLTIIFNKEFPHVITSWMETFPDNNGQTLQTKAVLKHTLNTDYWKKNAKRYEYLRDSLGLTN